jgi:hypothetical protein
LPRPEPSLDGASYSGFLHHAEALETVFHTKQFVISDLLLHIRREHTELNQSGMPAISDECSESVLLDSLLAFIAGLVIEHHVHRRLGFVAVFLVSSAE